MSGHGRRRRRQRSVLISHLHFLFYPTHTCVVLCSGPHTHTHTLRFRSLTTADENSKFPPLSMDARHHIKNGLCLFLGERGSDRKVRRASHFLVGVFWEVVLPRKFLFFMIRCVFSSLHSQGSKACQSAVVCTGALW